MFLLQMALLHSLVWLGSIPLCIEVPHLKKSYSWRRWWEKIREGHSRKGRAVLGKGHRGVYGAHKAGGQWERVWEAGSALKQDEDADPGTQGR